MPTTWTVEIRLGERPEATPVRRITVRADTELEALQAAARQMQDQPDGVEMLVDGQEEVFARAEVETGGPEHQAHSGDHSAPD